MPNEEEQESGIDLPVTVIACSKSAPPSAKKSSPVKKQRFISLSKHRFSIVTGRHRDSVSVYQYVS